MTYSAAQVYTQFTLLPPHLLLWLLWMGSVVFIVPLFLLRHRPARIVTLTQIGTITLGMVLSLQFGVSRILGVSHLIFWTPLVIYLLNVICHNTSPHHVTRWAWLFVGTASISLVIDAVDLVRFLLGDRGLLVAFS